MPCLPIITGNKRVGFLCAANDPVEIQHNGKTYRFEWTSASGWMPLNKDGSQRLTPIPNAVWENLRKYESDCGH